MNAWQPIDAGRLIGIDDPIECTLSRAGIPSRFDRDRRATRPRMIQPSRDRMGNPVGPAPIPGENIEGEMQGSNPGRSIANETINDCKCLSARLVDRDPPP
ncbi:MAG: hypothetical protein ABSB42_14905 [Tepidisphaeraceae bacterium]